MDQRVKVRIGNKKVIEMKQGSLETRNRNEARVFGNENGTRGSKGQSSGMGLHSV